MELLTLSFFFFFFFWYLFFVLFVVLIVNKNYLHNMIMNLWSRKNFHSIDAEFLFLCLNCNWHECLCKNLNKILFFVEYFSLFVICLLLQLMHTFFLYSQFTTYTGWQFISMRVYVCLLIAFMHVTFSSIWFLFTVVFHRLFWKKFHFSSYLPQIKVQFSVW